MVLPVAQRREEWRGARALAAVLLRVSGESGEATVAEAWWCSEAGAGGADLVRAVAVRSGTASASVGEGLGRSRTERSSGKLGAGAVQTLDRFGSGPIVGVTR
ncbi:hypothetical protein ACJRO7_001423 [Eucalyptus globulus]|uniref:Uncharacterized protein n=1 Tax=Eucalyptus globulus TaxID=34317 RepID=A0ABD3LQX4_EUCGL